MLTVSSSLKSYKASGVFLGGMLLILAAVALLPKKSFTGLLNDFFMLSFSVIVESVPFLILGSVLAALVQIFISFTWLTKILPNNPHLKRLFLSLFGVFLPVCECGNIPMARGLMLKGFTVSEAMVFLLAAPIVNPVTIITTHQAFGWDSGILICRILGGLAIANIIGWLFSRQQDATQFLTPSFEHSCRVEVGVVEKKSIFNVANKTASELILLFPALIVGAGIAAFIQVIVPRSTLLAIGEDPVLSVLVMLLLGVIVAICSNVDSFFALSFASTFTNGSLITFLLAGPLVDVKMIALMKSTFTSKAVLYIVLLVVCASVSIGLGVNLVS